MVTRYRVHVKLYLAGNHYAGVDPLAIRSDGGRGGGGYRYHRFLLSEPRISSDVFRYFAAAICTVLSSLDRKIGWNCFEEK